MRLIPSFFAALIALTALAACGTKTPLSLPPQAQPAAKTAVACPQSGIPCTQGAAAPTSATVDNSNKVIAEPRQ